MSDVVDGAGPDGFASSGGPAVAVLTLSPALDCTLRVSRLEAGRSHRAAPAAEVLGGKGINVARILADLGVRVAALGPVARDHWPREDCDHGPREGRGHGPREDRGPSSATAEVSPLTWDLTATPAALRRSIAVVEDSGRATLVNEASHPHPREVWDALRDTVEKRVREPGLAVLVISGSTPEDCPSDLVPGLIASAHAAGVTAIVDTSAHGLAAAARAGADWLKPNDDELREIVPDLGGDAGCAGTDAEGSTDLVAAAQRLIAAGAGHILVSQGADGMTLVDATGERGHARLDRTLHGNPTGAGDAAVATLAWTLAERGAQAPTGRGHTRLGEDEIAPLLTRAVAIAASAVLMPQAGQIHPSWPELRDQVLLAGERDGSAADPPAPAAADPSAPAAGPPTVTRSRSGERP